MPVYFWLWGTDGERSKHYDTYLEVEKGNVTIEASENGKYQGFKGRDSDWEYLIDTRNGAMWYSDGAEWVQQIKEVLPEWFAG